FYLFTFAFKDVFKCYCGIIDQISASFPTKSTKIKSSKSKTSPAKDRLENRFKATSKDILEINSRSSKYVFCTISVIYASMAVCIIDLALFKIRQDGVCL